MNSITETSSITMADRIRQLRKEHGLTQEDLAAKAGLGVAEPLHLGAYTELLRHNAALNSAMGTHKYSRAQEPGAQKHSSDKPSDHLAPRDIPRNVSGRCRDRFRQVRFRFLRACPDRGLRRRSLLRDTRCASAAIAFGILLIAPSVLTAERRSRAKARRFPFKPSSA